MAIRSESGVVKELPRPFSNVWSYDWSSDEQSVVFRAMDLEGRTGIFVLDVATGRARPVLITNAEFGYQVPVYSPDGRSLQFVRVLREQEASAIIERNLDTGVERELLPPRPWRDRDLRRGWLSPDGQWAWDIENQPASVLSVVNVADGSVREVFRANGPMALDQNGGVQWMPDSRALVAKVMGQAPNERALWWIPIDGRAARKIDLGRTDVVDTAIAIHPDGRRIAFVAGDPIASKTSNLTTEFRWLDGLWSRLPVAQRKAP